MLTSFSILIVGSAKESLQSRQLFGMIVGIICMLLISLIDYKWLIKFKWIFYVGNILLLLATEIWGKNVNGATRWIDLEFTVIQPSEFVKISLILFLANHLGENKERINDWKFLLQTFILMGLPIALILNQPDLSTTISIVLLLVSMIFLTGLDYKIIGTVLLIVVPVVSLLFLYIIQPNQVLIKDYQQTRVLAWLQPDEYASDEGFQQNNSKVAIGSGQLSGKGLNNNTTTSVKNGNFILEPQTDFIFAIIGEELGFMGCCGVITLLLLIIVQCLLLGTRTFFFPGKLICYGMGSLIAYQSFINIGVATGVLPNTGIPLPFVSYGLSSLISMFMGIGIVLNIGLQQKKFQ